MRNKLNWEVLDERTTRELFPTSDRREMEASFFAKLLGAIFGRERPTTFYWTSTNFDEGRVRSVNNLGSIQAVYANRRFCTVRPALLFSEIEEICPSAAKTRVGDIFESNLEYPLDRVHSDTEEELDKYFDWSPEMLSPKKTGRTYTVDSYASYNDSNGTEKFKPRVLEEIEHKGRKYVRLMAMPYENGGQLKRDIRRGEYYFVEVKKLKFYRLEDKNGVEYAVPEKGLFSGIYFDLQADFEKHNYSVDNDIEVREHFLGKYIDNYFARDIEQSLDTKNFTRDTEQSLDTGNFPRDIEQLLNTRQLLNTKKLTKIAPEIKGNRFPLSMKFQEPQTEKEIKRLSKLGKKVFAVSSYEWERVQSAIRRVAKENDQEVIIFDSHMGLRAFGNTKMESINPEATTLAQAIDFFTKSTQNIVMIVNNFDEGSEITSKPNLAMISQLFRDYNYPENSAKNKQLVLCSQTKYVPQELSEELPVIEVKLPDKGVLREVAARAMEEFSFDPSMISEKVVESALGLTTMQAEEAFKKAIIEYQKLGDKEIGFVIKQKETIINRSGVLECMHPNVNLKDVGGLENLKEWLGETKEAFSSEARDFGIPTPRGVLLLGIPGTGKSLAAKAVASEWKLPLVKFDIGKAFGSLVGESESKMRYALDVASSAAPCVLWVDEIEKGLSGLESSGRSDGGTTARVFGSFLTWMQEKQEPVFVVATANDISKLPPELLRKGRFDEIFFIDLPTTQERQEILNIHLGKIKPTSKSLKELKEVANKTVGFTGAELESVVTEGLKKAFRSPDRKLTNEHLLSSVQNTKPSSVVMKEKINAIREQAENRMRFASKKEDEGDKQ